MQLLEEYQELIERDCAEISFLWKALQIFFYLSSAVAGYICSILFFTFWNNIFGGNCPLWAKVRVLQTVPSETADAFDGYSIRNAVVGPNFKDWRQNVIIDYDYEGRCKTYFITCLSSCTFGIVWLILFSMCGRGGYDTRIYNAPWRIVLPALVFTSVFTILTVHSTLDLENGYLKMSNDISELFLDMSDIDASKTDVRECEIVQSYAEIYDPYQHNLCRIFLGLQILSRVMMWSWIGGLALLIIRVIRINDFHLLKVKVYEVPYDKFKVSSNDVDTNDVEAEESQKEKED